MSESLEKKRQDAIQVWTVDEPYIRINCALGEGPHYQESTRTVRFVDIDSKKLYRFNVDRGPESLETLDTGDQVGVTADIEGVDDKIAVAAKYGYAIMDAKTGKLTYLNRPWSADGEEKTERMRFNDGAIDPVGRFLAGSMTDNLLHNPINEGALFSLDPATPHHPKKLLSPVHISNGMAWPNLTSTDPIPASGKTTLLFTDSPTRTIAAYDYDLHTGDIDAASRREWFRLPDTADFPRGTAPDGMVLDERGDVWTAIYGSGKVLRLRDVDNKAVQVGEVRLPTKNVTCPCFIGEGDLLVTSLGSGAEEGDHFAGMTFRLHVGVQGAEVRKWKGRVSSLL